MTLTRRTAVKLGVGAAAAAIGPSLGPGSASASGPSLEQALRSRIKAPTFADRWFPITDFGATTEDATSAIAAAIAACHAAGGGHVLIPSGTWNTGAIHLLSRVDLHLAEGSTLRFSTDPSDYLPVVRTRWQAVELYNYSPLIHANEATDIGITGSGTLDGAGDNSHWWYLIGSGQYGWHSGLPNQRADWAALESMNNTQVPVEQRVFGEGHYLRPSFIQPFRCTNVVIEGVTVKDSPMWTIHPLECRNVTVKDVTVRNLGPNGDGCNPESCTDVLITGSTFATHDDCIAIKSGRDADGRRLGLPTSGVIVEDCTFESGGAAVAVGSEMSGGVENVFVRRLRMPEDPLADEAFLQWILCVKSTSTRGGYVRNVDVRGVDCRAWTYRPLEITFSYQGGGESTLYPQVSGIRIGEMKVFRAERPYRSVGAPSAPIRDVRIENSSFEQATGVPQISDTVDLQLSNIWINQQRVH